MADPLRILVVHGPNLNLLGTREPEVYGSTSLEDIEQKLDKQFSDAGLGFEAFQSNHEGRIIDFLHQNREAAYCIINPGGLTHTSVALRDAFASIEVPFIEVHISNVHAREAFRHHSFLSAISSGTIVGCGVYGYEMAADLVLQRL